MARIIVIISFMDGIIYLDGLTITRVFFATEWDHPPCDQESEIHEIVEESLDAPQASRWASSQRGYNWRFPKS
jgi:hypothetical protein